MFIIRILWKKNCKKYAGDNCHLKLWVCMREWVSEII